MNNDNNYVHVCGYVKEDVTFSHEDHGVRFYRSAIEVARLSGNIDKIPIIISENLLGEYPLNFGECYEIWGQFRSFNQKAEDGHSHLLLFLFVGDIIYPFAQKPDNYVRLTGTICKKPVFRTTPLSCREITDILIAVNRSYNKSDYIPCILWGENAKEAKELNIGDEITVNGRFQSREYVKRISEDTSVLRTAFEMSASKLRTMK